MSGIKSHRVAFPPASTRGRLLGAMMYIYIYKKKSLLSFYVCLFSLSAPSSHPPSLHPSITPSLHLGHLEHGRLGFLQHKQATQAQQRHINQLTGSTLPVSHRLCYKTKRLAALCFVQNPIETTNSEDEQFPANCILSSSTWDKCVRAVGKRNLLVVGSYLILDNNKQRWYYSIPFSWLYCPKTFVHCSSVELLRGTECLASSEPRWRCAQTDRPGEPERIVGLRTGCWPPSGGHWGCVCEGSSPGWRGWDKKVWFGWDSHRLNF